MTHPVILAFLVFAFVWAVVSFYYQQAIRPYICDVVRFAIFRRRDLLREMAVSGEADCHSFAFRYLEDLFNRMVRSCSWVSISTFIEFEMSRGKEATTPDIQRFDQEAPKQLKRLEEEALDCMMLVMAGNSPGWTLMAALVYMVSKVSGWALERWVHMRTRVLWHEDFGDLAPASA